MPSKTSHHVSRKTNALSETSRPRISQLETDTHPIPPLLINPSAVSDSEPEPEVERIGATGVLEEADVVTHTPQVRSEHVNAGLSNPQIQLDSTQPVDLGHVRSPILAR